MFDENGTVLQNYSYYPFGMEMNGFDYMASSTPKNNYLYNPEKQRFFKPVVFRGSSKNYTNQRFAIFRDGKELQDDFGLDWYDLTFRLYNSTLGHFINPDPLSDFMPGISPYSYAYDNPILFSDPDGLGPKNWWRKIKDFTMTKVLGYHKYGNYKANNVYYRKFKKIKHKKKYVKTYTKPGSITPHTLPFTKPDAIENFSMKIINVDAIKTEENIPVIEQSPNNIALIYDNPQSRLAKQGAVITSPKRLFPANSSSIYRNRTTIFIAPIAQLLVSNPNFAVSIIVSTKLQNQVINMDGGTSNATVNELLWKRGLAVQRALLNMGVDSTQVVFITSPGSKSQNISIMYRKR